MHSQYGRFILASFFAGLTAVGAFLENSFSGGSRNAAESGSAFIRLYYRAKAGLYGPGSLHHSRARGCTCFYRRGRDIVYPIAHIRVSSGLYARILGGRKDSPVRGTFRFAVHYGCYGGAGSHIPHRGFRPVHKPELPCRQARDPYGYGTNRNIPFYCSGSSERCGRSAVCPENQKTRMEEGARDTAIGSGNT